MGVRLVECFVSLSYFSLDLHLLLVIHECSQLRFKNSQQGKRGWEVRNERGRRGFTIHHGAYSRVHGLPAMLEEMRGEGPNETGVQGEMTMLDQPKLE